MNAIPIFQCNKLGQIRKYSLQKLNDEVMKDEGYHALPIQTDYWTIRLYYRIKCYIRAECNIFRYKNSYSRQNNIQFIRVNSTSNAIKP